MHKIPTKILYILIPIFAVGIFLIDSFFYIISQFEIGFNLSVITISLKSLREFVIIALMITTFVVVKRRFPLSEMEISQKLWSLTLLLTANFVVVFILKMFFSGYIDAATRPQDAFATVIYVFYMNIIGLLAIGTLIPIVLIIRELIFYKQRRTTRLYFNLFLALLIISTIWVYSSEKLMNFSVLWFNSADSDVYNTILVWSLTIIIVFLSFRNDWITYLPRKKKVLYFTIGLIVFAQIVSLRETIYIPHLPDYSMVVANFANIMWFFLLLYGSFSMLTLMVHLPTARAVDRKLKEVNSLYDFARKLNTELNYQKLPQLITRLTSEVLESQSAWLELYREKEDTLKLVSHINLTQEQILNNPFDEIAAFNKMLITGREPVLINDITQNPHLKHLTRWKKDARSFIASPLFSSRDQLMGIIYGCKSQPYGFDVDDLSLLEGFANQAAIALENANLWQASLERERLKQELKIAREVQLKLVPQEMPQFKGFEVDSYFLTAYEVGGDYYDFIEFEDKLPGVVIGDVSGKGTSAAFYMAEFKGVIQTLARTLQDPKELICQANRIFYSTIERQTFVTAIVGKFIPEQNTFRFVRAGHTPLLHLCEDKTKYVQPEGLGIGLDKGPIFDSVAAVHNIKFSPGEALILFTDGLVELRNKSGDEFGDERLQSSVSNVQNLSATGIKEHIIREVMDFVEDTPLHDDLTFIVIKFIGESGPEKKKPGGPNHKLNPSASGNK